MFTIQTYSDASSLSIAVLFNKSSFGDGDQLFWSLSVKGIGSR
jgi:hypothetical protein